jgi:transcriptional regulator with XRE-family HTH domain
MQAYDDARKRLSDNVKQARRKAGLSQEALALHAGINRSYVGQIERRIGNPSLQVLTKLAATLHVDVADLIKKAK